MPWDFRAFYRRRSDASDVMERFAGHRRDDLRRARAMAGSAGTAPSRGDRTGPDVCAYRSTRAADETPPTSSPRAAQATPADRRSPCCWRAPPRCSRGWYGYHWWTVGRFIVSTDDAYVGATTATLAAKVPGYIATPRRRRQRLGQGGRRHRHASTTATTSSRPTTARDKVATQQATIERHRPSRSRRSSRPSTRPRRSSSRPRRAPTRAGARACAPAGRSRERIREPADAGAGARESRPGGRGRAGRASRVDAAPSQRRGARKAQQEEAQPHAEAVTRPRSPRPSAISPSPWSARPSTASSATAPCRSATTCSRAQRLASLVPLDAVYIDANFKETQLAGLQPGRAVSIDLGRRAARPRHHGTRRERRAGLGLGVLAAAARQRHRQLHQDRAALAGAHRGAGRRSATQGCCGPACRSWPASNTRPRRRHRAGAGRRRRH